MSIKKLTREEFDFAIKELGVKENADFDFLYEAYLSVVDTVQNVIANSDYSLFSAVHSIVIVLYVINEYLYSIKDLTSQQIKELSEDEEFFKKIVTLSADKYLTNEQLNFKSDTFLNKFNPVISMIELYLNFALRILDKKYENNENEKLIQSMLTKAFKLSKCIISLLIDGFETESFSTWRTLHENECILLCLTKYGDEMFKEYFKHVKYALAYRGQIKDKERTDEIFNELKDEMKSHDLKSKDMKKFIEYGYLFCAPNVILNENFKLNFRDGVEKLAGLSMYSKVYEMASEIAHSSPLLLFSRRDYFFNITLLNLYETFFRLEAVFYNFYKTKIAQEDFNNYELIRNTYLEQLKLIYKNIQSDFLKFFKNDDSYLESL